MINGHGPVGRISWRGSTLFHALPYAMTSAGIASVLKFHPYFRPFMANRGSDGMFESAFSIQLFASLVGFLVVGTRAAPPPPGLSAPQEVRPHRDVRNQNLIRGAVHTGVSRQLELQSLVRG